MANRDHPTIRIVSDDTILLASSLIPGNENSVFTVDQRPVPARCEGGAPSRPRWCTVSGHAPAGELRYLLNAVPAEET